MSGRRSHVRFAVLRSPEGILRVMHDVIVQRASNRELIAISREPGVLGETVVIEFAAEETAAGLRLRVVESQPVVVNGTVRHRLRLEALGGASAHSETESDHQFALQRGDARK